jgi:hypothetical protein
VCVCGAEVEFPWFGRFIFSIVFVQVHKHFSVVHNSLGNVKRGAANIFCTRKQSMWGTNRKGVERGFPIVSRKPSSMVRFITQLHARTKPEKL